MRYRRVRAEGRYLGEAQVWLDNRTHHGTPGYRILTPLEFADRSHVLVDRGWIAASARHGIRPDAPPPAGSVNVEGRLNAPPASFLELAHAAPTDNVWQNLDLAAYARATGLAVAPLVIEETPGAGGGLVREWVAPDLGRDTNVSYMWQWYSFAMLAFALWAVLGWRRSDAR
jgi:surfeit locus 1 family protein